ncbi:MAG: hypothetical protein ABJB01_01925 [Rudaea sp.]
MLKLLRNLALAAILLAGALKLLAWYAVGHDAERVTAALAPFAQLKYDGISAGLDGSVTFTGVTVAHAATHQIYRADTLTLQTPGLFWLLQHTLLHDTTVPQSLALDAQGLHLPPTPWLDPQFVDPTTLVPFAGAGCGAAFTAADYRRMTSAPAVTNAHIDYRYQSEQHAVDVKATLSTPGYSVVSLRADLQPFDIGILANRAMWEKLHASQLGADFTDDGFISRRNQFCAQRLGISAGDFAARHISAVQAILADHRVEPSNELIGLYRNLVEHGGQASVLSLPKNTFVLRNWRDSAPDDLLRLLNITARYRDTPPVMFRLSFIAPPQDGDATVASTGAVTTLVAAAATTVAPSAAVTTAAVTAAPTIPATTKPITAAAPDPSPAAPPKRANDNLGLHDLDRVEAKLAPKQAPIKTPPTPEPAKPVVTDAPFASGPAPPPNSTLALVWKPTIERLPTATATKSDYEVIEYGGLQNALGQRVRLITDGAKRIEGYVIAADAGSVRLRVGRRDGDAQFDVPKKRILEVQLLRRAPPA